MGNVPASPHPPDPATQCQVVIVGGSFAGLCVARHLERHQASLALSLTVVEPKEYFEYTPGILRAIVDDSYDAEHLLVPMSRTVREPTKVLQGWFVGMKEKNKVGPRCSLHPSVATFAAIVYMPFGYVSIMPTSTHVLSM